MATEGMDETTAQAAATAAGLTLTRCLNGFNGFKGVKAQGAQGFCATARGAKDVIGTFGSAAAAALARAQHLRSNELCDCKRCTQSRSVEVAAPSEPSSDAWRKQCRNFSSYAIVKEELVPLGDV